MLSFPSFLRGRSPARTICWLLLADFVFCIGFAVWSRTLAYDSQIREGVAASRTLADAALHHAESTLDTAGWMLAGVVERVEADGIRGADEGALRRLMLARVQDKRSPLAALCVADAAGGVVAAPCADGIVGAASAYHRVHVDRDIHVAAPAGAQALMVSRRIDGADGRYAGVVVATIPLRYFEDQYRRMEPGPHGQVALALADGTPVTRFPVSAEGDRDGARAPAIRLKTKETEIERLHTALRSARYPLAVDAAVGRDDVLADWRRVTWQESAALAGEMFGVYLVCFWVIAQMRVRERLERTLRSTQEALEKQNAALARLADTDGLTGLANRRHLDERMALEVARAARERTPLSLIMIDVDFFKRYNDTYGHAAGDDCLRMVGRVLAATVNRPADLAARYGGEEFAVLLPNTDREGARNIAEAICQGVRTAGMPHGASELGFVTISAGVATAVPAPGGEARALVETADAALYEAKEAGRNGVRAH